MKIKKKKILIKRFPRSTDGINWRVSSVRIDKDVSEFLENKGYNRSLVIRELMLKKAKELGYKKEAN